MTEKTKLWIAGGVFVVGTALLVLEYLTDLQWVTLVGTLLSWVGM